VIPVFLNNLSPNQKAIINNIILLRPDTKIDSISSSLKNTYTYKNVNMYVKNGLIVDLSCNSHLGLLVLVLNVSMFIL